MQQGNLTDISNLPESQNRVKPQDTKLEQPSSQRSTMQSFGDVPAGGQENITLNDQGQPGSLENLTGDQEKTGASGFLQKATGFVQGLIQKAGLGTAQAQDAKQEIQKRAYLKRKSVRRALGKPAQARTFKGYMGSYKRNLGRQGRRLAQLRWRARGVISQAFRSQKEQIPQQFSEDPKQFVLNFNANQWNTQSGFKAAGKKFQKQQDQIQTETDPKQYVLQFSAHDWNDMSNLNASQRATYYMARAQNFLKDTSRNLSSWNLQRNTRRFKNQAQKKKVQIKRQLKEKIPQAQK